MGVENNIFWSAIRSGFGEPGTTPHQEFPVVPPSGDQEQGVNHVIIIIAWNITLPECSVYYLVSLCVELGNV